MCDCQQKIKERLVNKFKEDNPATSNHAAILDGYALIIDDYTYTIKPFMPVRIKADFPLKNGGVKERMTKSNLIFSFCPFCGEKLTGK